METKLESATAIPPAPLATLSADDHALLELFLNPHVSLLLVAQKSGTTLIDLMNRLHAAPMQAALGAYRALADLAASITAARARAAAIATLEKPGRTPARRLHHRPRYRHQRTPQGPSSRG